MRSAGRLASDPGVDRVTCAPGNAGIAREFQTFAVDPADPEAVLALADQQQHRPHRRRPRSAAWRAASSISSAPAAAPSSAPADWPRSSRRARRSPKNSCARHGVPTARFRVCATLDDALSCIRRGEFGDALVVKADGLAAGKGVVVAATRARRKRPFARRWSIASFGEAGARVVLEERLTGPEVSFFVIADGEHAVPLVAAQDHKRIFDDDRGPNTGGMGAFAPSPLVDDALQSRVIRARSSGPVLMG